ncbi:hypothetical protein BDA99DRAFT_511316 [Phascolomyces articulosus]|uniref:Uncharacterized protein n=1 Tax=Phascolomyces articulosus TaxID=60185 RepID=A0AAD5KC14_9FUNG|nr:hypothetical protein BDA99DRAFT_511316 [Phascolomyces articulosus]
MFDCQITDCAFGYIFYCCAIPFCTLACWLQIIKAKANIHRATADNPPSFRTT